LTELFAAGAAIATAGWINAIEATAAGTASAAAPSPSSFFT
jgi:hypothetical protein